MCYVYILRMKKEQADFITTVPIRTAELLRGQVSIHLIYSGYINIDKLRQHEVACHRFEGLISRLPLIRYIGLAFFIYRVGKREKINIFMNVWAHYILLPVILGARLSGSRVIARISGIPIQGSHRRTVFGYIRNRIGLILEALSLKAADGIHVLSESLASVYKERGVEFSRLTVISQGCDVASFMPGGESCKRDSANRRILYVGRLAPNKGIDDAIHAFEILVRDRGADLEFIIAGAGPQTEPCKDMCRRLGISQQVKFLGHVEHTKLPELYSSCDVLVLPSRSEGLPNVILEAQACGLLVVATDVGAIPELLGEGRGLLVHINDPQGLAEKLKMALYDEELRKAIIEKARSYVVHEHSYQAVREKYLLLFQKLVRGKESK